MISKWIVFYLIVYFILYFNLIDGLRFKSRGLVEVKCKGGRTVVRTSAGRYFRRLKGNTIITSCGARRLARYRGCRSCRRCNCNRRTAYPSTLEAMSLNPSKKEINYSQESDQIIIDGMSSVIRPVFIRQGTPTLDQSHPRQLPTPPLGFTKSTTLLSPSSAKPVSTSIEITRIPVFTPIEADEGPAKEASSYKPKRGHLRRLMRMFRLA